MTTQSSRENCLIKCLQQKIALSTLKIIFNITVCRNVHKIVINVRDIIGSHAVCFCWTSLLKHKMHDSGPEILKINNIIDLKILHDIFTAVVLKPCLNNQDS